MSTVVYHNGVMAADSRAYSGSTHPIGFKRKIHRVQAGPYAGALVGVTTNVVGMAEGFRAWLERGARTDDIAPGDPSFAALLVTASGEIFLFNDAYYCAGPLTCDTLTIGSGKKYALAAIKCGKTPVEAVQIAAECDLWTGGPIDVLTLNPESSTPIHHPV